MLILLFVFWMSCEANRKSDLLLPQLHYFEILLDSDISHSITKRGIHHSYYKYSIIKEVSFKALGKYFRLILNPTQGLLSSGFKAFSVDGHGKKQPVWIDKSKFFEGRIFGEKHSKVTAHIDDDGLITASVHTSDDAYIIEPSWRHLPNDNNSTMIIYRDSDIKYNWEANYFDKDILKLCSCTQGGGNSSEINEDNLHHHKRVKKAINPGDWIPVKTRCSLLLVADYRFFANMGGGNVKGTINFLISLIDRVNKLFLETEWKGSDKQIGFSGMGFVIKEIMVHTEPTLVPQGEKHYNMRGVSWEVKSLLENFSHSISATKYCLAHLFTDQIFSDRILGLGYVGSDRINSAGGICSSAYNKKGYTLYLNSALSTSRNYYGQRIITREADLVTAHEFGHNWGSEHDPDIPECSPNAKHGGSYLMNTFSVGGYDPNNKKFSPCSIRSIRSVLLVKASKCFSAPEESFCGNSLVEEGEQCDAGLIGNEDSDPCCDTNCAFQENAVCSDKNSPCCYGCQYISAGVICRHAQPTACKQESYCTGNSSDCPPSLPQRNNTLCLDSCIVHLICQPPCSSG